MCRGGGSGDDAFACDIRWIAALVGYFCDCDAQKGYTLNAKTFLRHIPVQRVKRVLYPGMIHVPRRPHTHHIVCSLLCCLRLLAELCVQCLGHNIN